MADAAVVARKAVKSARNANKEKAVLQQTVAEVKAARDAATARATEAEDLAKRAEEDATRADARAKEAARVASAKTLREAHMDLLAFGVSLSVQ